MILLLNATEFLTHRNDFIFCLVNWLNTIYSQEIAQVAKHKARKTKNKFLFFGHTDLFEQEKQFHRNARGKFNGSSTNLCSL